MRISDWSSDVCSSDLQIFLVVDLAQIDILGHRGGFDARLAARPQFGLLRREAIGSLERPCRYFDGITDRPQAPDPFKVIEEFFAILCETIQDRPLRQTEESRVGKEGVKASKTEG